MAAPEDMDLGLANMGQMMMGTPLSLQSFMRVVFFGRIIQIDNPINLLAPRVLLANGNKVIEEKAGT